MLSCKNWKRISGKSRHPMQRLTLYGVDELGLVLLRLLVEAFDLVVPFRLGIGFANEGQRRVAFQTFRQFDKNIKILSDEFLTKAF